MIRSAALLVLVLSSAFAFKALVDAGAFRAIHPHFDGSCRPVGPIDGPEDVELARGLGAVFISSDHRPQASDPHPGGGDLYFWGLTTEGAVPKKLEVRLGNDFHPHGMSTWEVPGGARLWVINHRDDRTTVEVFDFRSGVFEHLRTLESPLLANANDLAATGPDTFYVTSDHGSRSGFLNSLEDYSRIGRAYVSYFDGSVFSVQARGIRYANGIVFDSRSGRVLVAAMLGRSVRVYSRGEGGALSLEKEIPLEGAPDNLTLDESGTIWVGAHPNLLALKRQSSNHRAHAPAQVLRIRNALGPEPEISEVFSDTGERISAVSVALHWGRRLILGSIFDDHLLDCSISGQ